MSFKVNHDRGEAENEDRINMWRMCLRAYDQGSGEQEDHGVM